jgi:tRNA 2-selenouridine synthase
VTDVELFCRQLQALTELRGGQTVQRWQELARAQAAAGAALNPSAPGPLAQVVQELLEQHYDPVYLRSMQRNYTHFQAAVALPLPGTDADTLRQVADALIAVDPGVV